MQIFQYINVEILTEFPKSSSRKGSFIFGSNQYSKNITESKEHHHLPEDLFCPANRFFTTPRRPRVIKGVTARLDLK